MNVVCKEDREANVHALLLQGLSIGGIQLRRLDSSNIENSDRVEAITVDRERLRGKGRTTPCKERTKK